MGRRNIDSEMAEVRILVRSSQQIGVKLSNPVTIQLISKTLANRGSQAPTQPSQAIGVPQHGGCKEVHSIVLRLLVR
ncbi:MAG: hypothetical protein A2V98_18860 [Planctomycetes bacterium RBG_16_64_12]|nr:MAG: hypothetical protein A2V98_18860 [Planctomycetes bacterium RBG_16_64_12]